MAESSDNNAGGSSGTLSQLFDKVYDDFKKVVDGDDTNSPQSQELLSKTVKALEQLTNYVSALDMFSKNENYEELEPSTLKFLLIPYMLGVLWQISTKESRKTICTLSSVYFNDFLKRCIEYELISETETVIEEKDGEEKVRVLKKYPPDVQRQRKIQKFKENAELEAKIQAYKKYAEKFTGEDADTAPLKEIYVAVIKRAINDSQEQLDSIATENELIAFGEREGPENLRQHAATEERKPLKPFIIAKDGAQKAVFGAGYPSLPIMTVEELYQQRRETGEWGPPPAAGHSQAQMPSEGDAEEEEAKQKEHLEEREDEMELARKRQFDDYKDDHRRGWGNRFNRS